MGWNGGNFKNAKMVREIFEKDLLTSKYTIISRKIKGRNTWYALDFAGMSFILYLLIRKVKKDDFEYKDVTESMGPLALDCPLELLKITQGSNPSWREKVLAYHQKKKQEFKNGDYVKVWDKNYRILRKEKQNYLLVPLFEPLDKLYKAKPEYIEKLPNLVDYLVNEEDSKEYFYGD